MARRFRRDDSLLSIVQQVINAATTTLTSAYGLTNAITQCKFMHEYAGPTLLISSTPPAPPRQP